MLYGKVYEKVRNHRLFADFLTPATLHQIKRYLITGFSSAAIELSLLYILKDLSGLGVIEANSIALTIVFWFNFLMNRFFSFKSSGSIKRQLIMYGILFVFNLGASDLIMHLLTTALHIQYLIAKVFAIGAVVSWNFVLYKKVIYK